MLQHFMLQIFNKVLQKLKKAYEQVLNRIGDPLEDSVLVGPLHSATSVEKYLQTITQIKENGGVIEFGGKVHFQV